MDTTNNTGADPRNAVQASVPYIMAQDLGEAMDLPAILEAYFSKLSDSGDQLGNLGDIVRIFSH